MNELTCKKALTVQEQIDYLKTNKRVTFNEINEDTAKKILLKYNYVNVITPFQKKFCA